MTFPPKRFKQLGSCDLLVVHDFLVHLTVADEDCRNAID
jgi:hypothetical protein